MKKIKFLILMLLLFFVCASVSASDVNETIGSSEDNNLVNASSILEINNEINYYVDNVQEDSYSQNDSSNKSQTIIIGEIGEYYIEMNKKKISNAINSANDGDTIIIISDKITHAHIMIDKKLTIKSTVGTVLDPNISNVSSGNRGVFYITSNASGTIIEGFNFINEGTIWDDNDYGVFVDGASNVTIRNCTFSLRDAGSAIRLNNAKSTSITNVNISNTANGIQIKNSQNVNVDNSNISNSNFGIYDIDSTKTTINFNNILNNKIAGIAVAGSSNNLTISYNNITNNYNGINLTSSENINILSNYIANSTFHGVYVNCQITKINIIGNFFYKNIAAEVFNDKNTKGLYVKDGENLEVITNNYIIGLGNHPVQRADSVGGGVFLGHIFEINTNVYTPLIYATYNTLWSNANYRLQLSEIRQSKKGIYSISIVDAEGNVAKGLSSVPVTFYLNKNNNYTSPQEEDVYKTVMMVDGTATVRFYPEDFMESDNVVTAVLPGYGNYLTSNQGVNVKTFNVDDNVIPGIISPSIITISNLTTFANSPVKYTISLKDIYGNPIANEYLYCAIGGTIITDITTNDYGQATIIINENCGNYTFRVHYPGDDIDWGESYAEAKITVLDEAMNVLVNNVTYKEDAIVEIKFTNNISGTVTVQVKNQTYSGTVENGTCNIILSNLNAGNHTVEVYFNSTIIKTFNRTVFEIYKSLPELSISIDNILEEEDICISPITSSDVEGTIDICLDDEYIGTIDINNDYYLSDLEIGKHELEITYNGDKNYLSRTVKKIFYVFSFNPIELENTKIIFGSDKRLEAQVYDEYGDALINKYIIFKVNGSDYSARTDSEGIAILDEDLAIGCYEVTVIIPIYNQNITTDLKVFTSINSSDVYSIHNNDFNFEATFLDEEAEKLINIPIIFKINGEDKSVITNENGVANLKLNLDIGIYEITSINTVTNEIKVNKLYIQSDSGKYTQDINDADIIIPPLANAVSESVSVRLPDDATGTITLNINGKNYSFDVVNGIASIKVSDLANGVYSYSITYSGDAKYSSFTKTGSITINKKTTSTQTVKTTITLKTVKVKKSAKKLVLQATLKKGKTPLKSKKITFKFNGKKYTAKTNKKGVAKVTIKKSVLKKLKVGKKVKYQASYGKITAKKTVKIKK